MILSPAQEPLTLDQHTDEAAWLLWIISSPALALASTGVR